MISLNEQTINELFDSYADMVYRIALNILRNCEEAQDIVMDTFTALIKQDNFDSESHVKAWLIRTAHNKAVNVVKSARMRHSIPLDELLQQLLPAPKQSAEYELLDIVMRLPDKLKTPIYMFYYEDMTAAEIAAALKISENTVYKRLERGRAALKTELEEAI